MARGPTNPEFGCFPDFEHLARSMTRDLTTEER
jgi:hypothetical protein